MSLESILDHIIEQANAQKDKIIQEANQEADAIVLSTQQEAEKLYREIIDKEKSLCQAEKQKLIVNARLESRKKVLATKQELISEVFEKLKSEIKKDKFSRSGGIPRWTGKKQQVLPDKVKDVPEDIDFYLQKIRRDNETEIAKILFV